MDLNALLTEHYGLNDCQLTPLEGYDSVNYKVSCPKGTFVLKEHPYTEAIFQRLQGEHTVLDHVSEIDGYDFPKYIATSKGDSMLIKGDKIYRLLSYVEGEFLGDVPHTPTLLHSFGRFLAKMDTVTLTVHSSAIAAKETPWDLRHFRSNYQHLPCIPDPKDRNLVDYFFLQFDEHVLPLESQLRKGIIHNDGNDWNVLSQGGAVSGIIDFGDMCHTWLINEVAVALTYVMMEKDDPLETAFHLIQGYHEIVPLQEQELDVLYYLIAGRICTSVCNSAHAKIQKPDSDYITISERPAWDLLRTWLSINPIAAADSFRKAAGFPLLHKKPLTDQWNRRKSHLSGALSLSYTRPIQMNRSAFQYMYDEEGNTFLDAYNNIMLAGHCHPKVVRAGQRKLAKLNTNTRYLYEDLLAYSEKLLAKFPSKLNKVFLVNSGSAASDLAIRMAMTHTRKSKIMVLEHGYHGNTRMGIDISHYKYNQTGGLGRQEYVLQTEMPKAYGSGYPDQGEAGDYFADRAKRSILENRDEIAAFIAEPIVGCGGQVPLAQGYLPQVYAEVRKQGGLCISDEVQVGFGRLGSHFWGFEMHDVTPDMVIIGKPMGNGHPIGGVVTTSEIAESFDNGLEFFSSFGGNPVSCTIGHAVLEVIEEESLQTHAQEIGSYLTHGLRRLQEQHIELGDIRGSGLFLGVEMIDKAGKPNTSLAAALKNTLREKHILISTDGPFDNVLKIKPPLSFNKKNADTLIAAIDQVLVQIKKN